MSQPTAVRFQRLGQCICEPCPVIPVNCTDHITFRLHSPVLEAIYVGIITVTYILCASFLIYRICKTKWAHEGDSIPGAATILLLILALLVLYSYAVMGALHMFMQ